MKIGNGEQENAEKRWSIPKDGELRLEVGHSNSLQLVLVSGDAEVFGTELVPDVKYTLKPGYCCSIHSWIGGVVVTKSIPIEITEKVQECEFNTSSQKDLIYLAQESPMLHYPNTHYYVKNLRDKASENETLGPRVLVCGAKDSGKSTLCQILLNYSIRNGNQCVYVDMDCGQNSLTVPGSISASYIDKQVTDLMDEIYFQDSYGISEKYSQMSCPLVYFVGDASLDECYDNYLHYTTILARNVLSKLGSSKRLKKSGCIINTCGYIVGNGLSAIEHIVKEFQGNLIGCFIHYQSHLVNVIIVLDNERLYTQLSSIDGVDSVLLPKSSGIVGKNTQYRTYRRMLSLKNYFYGIDGNYAPNIIKVPFDQISLYSISSINLLDSCIPLGFSGEKANLESNRIFPRLLTPTTEMTHHILGVVNAEDETQLTEKNVLGFVVILKVDTAKNRIKLLSPGDLPTRHLIYSNSIVYNHVSGAI